MEKLTIKQEAVLKELKKFIATYNYPPSVRDLCALTGLKSTATVQVHLETLQEKGYIKKGKDRNRAIELLVDNEYSNKKNDVISLPLLGMVTAGSPIEAIETPDNYFEVPCSMINSNKELFSLKVEGVSMINAGIFDGDIIIVEKENNAKSRDIVVAMINENEVTVKTFYKEKNYIRLQPENDTMEPIIVPNAVILGKVIGLYRSF